MKAQREVACKLLLFLHVFRPLRYTASLAFSPSLTPYPMIKPHTSIMDGSRRLGRQSWPARRPRTRLRPRTRWPATRWPFFAMSS